MCPLLKKRQRKLEVEDLTAVLRGGNGADDEVAGRVVESDGEKGHVVGAAEIIGVTDRTMRRWRERLETDGYSGLVDRRKA